MNRKLDGECSSKHYIGQFFFIKFFSTFISKFTSAGIILFTIKENIFKNKKVVLGTTLFYLYLLVITFLLSTFIKILISLNFNSPWILGDEVEYFIRAGAIFEKHDIFFVPYNAIVPPGNCLVLSLAYFFSTQKILIYHGMLVINSILTSLIIFPSFFILKKYCSEKKALLGSILILVLPAANVYCFSLLSENLFIVLCIICLWFFIEFIEKNSRLFLFLLTISLLLLVLTKPLGIGMVVGCLVGYIYIRFFESKKISPIYVILNKYVLALSLLVLIFIWYINKNYKIPPFFAYNPAPYLNNFFRIFENFKDIVHFFSLFINEMLYLILSSYFVFFITALVLVVVTLGIHELKIFEINTWWNSLDGKKKSGLTAGILFFIISSFITVVMTVIMMYTAPISLFPGAYDLFLLMGRYVDSIVPMIFIFGIIGIDQFYKNCSKFQFNYFWIFGLLLCITIFIFWLCFPLKTYLMTETFSISYIQGFKGFVPVIIMISGIFIGFSVFFILDILWKKELLFFCAILFSMMIIANVIPTQIAVSKLRENASPLILYLKDNLSDKNVVLMDREYWLQYMDVYWLAYYWANCTIIVDTINDKEPMKDTPIKGNPDYIISSKLLQYQKVQFPLPNIKQDSNLYKVLKNSIPYDQFNNQSGNISPDSVKPEQEYIWLIASDFSGITSFSTGWGSANGNPGETPNMVVMTAAGSPSGILINKSFNSTYAGEHIIWIRSWNFNFTDSKYGIKIDESYDYEVSQEHTSGNYRWVWISPGNCSIERGLHNVFLITDNSVKNSTTTFWGGVDIVLITNNLSYIPKDGEIPP